MKNGQIALFYGHLAQKTAQPARLRPPFLYLTPLFPRKYAAISPYYPFTKPREKSRAGCWFWLSDALRRTFFPKKYLTNSTARPFHKGRASKYFLVT